MRKSIISTSIALSKVSYNLVLFGSVGWGLGDHILEAIP